MKELRIGSFYTGYGGAEWGLKLANIPYKVVYYSEIKPAAIKIYEHNFGKHKNIGDITNINPNDLEDVDLITGGFPCQDVSLAGLRDLSKGRTQTVFKLLEIIKVKKPKYVLLENVQGILSMLDGELIKEIVRHLKNCGYAVCYDLLYSKDYGVPQNRPRVWIAAELGRSSFMFNPFPKKEELKIFVKDLLQYDIEHTYLTEKQINAIIKKSDERGKPLGNRIDCESSPTLTGKQHLADAMYVSSDIVNTITAGDYSKQAYHNQFIVDEPLLLSGQQEPHHNSLRLLENIKLRCLTPRECFRLQGFLNDEISFGDLKKTNLYDLAGNGWDVNLVSKIFLKWFS